MTDLEYWILIALLASIIYAGTGVWVSLIRAEASVRQLKRLQEDHDRKSKADLAEMSNLVANITAARFPSDEDAEDRWIHDLMKWDR